MNRAGLFWNDGGGRSNPGDPLNGIPKNRGRGAYFVDNDQDSSGGEVEGKFNLGEGWTAAVKIGMDAKLSSSNFVSQFDRAQGKMNELQVKEFAAEIGHEKWGKIKVGLADSASDGTSDVNLSGSNVVGDAEVNNWNDSFFLRVGGIGLVPLRWGDFFAGPNVGETGKFITYTTPKWHGLEFLVSVGQPLDVFLVSHPPAPFPGTEPVLPIRSPTVIPHTSGVQTDFGLKYSQVWDKTFLVKAAFGAFRNTTEEIIRPIVSGTNEITEDTGWGGSFAIRHIATGLNIAVNSATLRHTDKCAERGAVTNRCRGPETFVYLKGGMVKKFNTWGPTAWHAEFYRGWREPNENDEDVLRSLEANLDQAREVQKTVQTTWGLGLVQTIESTSTRPYITDLYVGYRNYTLDVRLIGDTGAVPTRPINNWSAVMAGMRLRWGKVDKDDDE